MTFEEFDKFQVGLIADVLKMCDTKGKEYANSLNRFDNFNRTASANDIHRLKVANVFMTKHWDSLQSYIRNNRVYSTESIRGRIIDLITYLTLVAGMIEEEGQEKDDTKLNTFGTSSEGR